VSAPTRQISFTAAGTCYNAAAGRVMQPINAAACRLVQCISEAVLPPMYGEQKKAPDCRGLR